MARPKSKDKSINGNPVFSQVLSRGGVILTGSAGTFLPRFPADSVQATITSPPYYRQKDYGRKGQIGWEKSVSEYTRRVADVLKEVLRVTTPTGCCFVIVGDSFVGKSLQLVPHRLAIAAADAGWTVRNDLIWAKSDAAPDGAADRWRYAHEHVLFLTKNPRGYKFNADAIRVPHSPVTIRRWGNGQKYGGAKAKTEAGPNGQRFKLGKTFHLNGNGALPRDVLEFATARSRLDHFATFPESLVERLILATTDKGDVILDPFAGTGTTGAVAVEHGRRFVGVELNPRYAVLGRKRLKAESVASNGHNGHAPASTGKSLHKQRRS
jgi:DNA modification methylase